MKYLMAVIQLIFAANAFAQDFTTETAVDLGIAKTQCLAALIPFDPKPGDKVITVKSETCKQFTVTVEGVSRQTYLACGAEIAKMESAVNQPITGSPLANYSIKKRVVDEASLSSTNHFFVKENNVCNKANSAAQIGQIKQRILGIMGVKLARVEQFKTGVNQCTQDETASAEAALNAAAIDAAMTPVDGDVQAHN